MAAVSHVDALVNGGDYTARIRVIVVLKVDLTDRSGDQPALALEPGKAGLVGLENGVEASVVDNAVHLLSRQLASCHGPIL